MSAYDTYVTARLATYRQAWEEAGDPGGLQQAFWFCQWDRIPFPDWVLDGLNRLLHERCGTETERHRWLRNRKHVRRWQLVQELRQCTPADFLAKFGEPKNRANIFWAAAQIEAEEETDAVAFFNPEPVEPVEPVSAETVKTSCRLVDQCLRAGKLGRFAPYFYAPGDKNWAKK